MAGNEDTELRDLVVEALERNGALAKVRALLRANIFLAFENEREPKHHNPVLDRLIASSEGTLALTIVAEFLDFCKLDNSAYVYKAESRQGRAYRYEGRAQLPENIAKQYTTADEPVLVTILRQSISNHRKKQSLSPNKETKKEDDNCTYIVHDESGSTRSHSDNSTDDKNKLLLRLPLDNSDTDTSSDSMRDKTSSEYIPNQNIQLDPDSDDESKHLHYILSPKSYMEESQCKFDTQARNYEPYVSIQNATYAVDEHTNIVNSSDSTSYLDVNPNTLLLKISNGNVETDNHSSNVASPSLPDITENIEESSERSKKPSEPDKQSTTDSHLKSVSSGLSNSTASVGVSTNKSIENQSFNYSDDFSPVQESSNNQIKQSSGNQSHRSTESGSIQEEISMNGSDQHLSSPRRTQDSSCSSISLSDVAELIENSARSSPSLGKNRATTQKSVIVRNSNLDEVAHRLTNIFRKEDEIRLSEDISESPMKSGSNISIDVHSD